MRSATAVVPLRDGSSGKTRLAAALAVADRSLLVASMARHVIGTLLTAPGIARVVVVTEDPEFVATALGEHTAQVLVVRQPSERAGLNPAVDLGREHAWADRPEHRLLIVHADLPALQVADVLGLLAEPAPVVLATDRAGTGTNALVLDPGVREFVFRFGPDSLPAHLAEAARLGMGTSVLRREGTATDLDTELDWPALPVPTRDRLLRDVPAMGWLSSA